MAINDLQRAQTMLAGMTEDRDMWRAKALAMLEVTNAVEHLQEFVFGGPPWLIAYAELVDQYDAWRALVENRIPPLWTVAPEPEPDAAADAVAAWFDAGDVPF